MFNEPLEKSTPITDSNIPKLFPSSYLTTRQKKFEVLGSFQSSYARAAFSFWNNPLDDVIYALDKGENVAICAPQGVGKTGFALPELVNRWNLSSPNTFAKSFEDGDEIDWTQGFDVAIVDEASRFCRPQRKYLDMEKYTSIPELDERLGVNASFKDLPYFIHKAKQNDVQLVLITPDSTLQSRETTRAILLQHGLTVVEVLSPTLDPQVVNQYLVTAGINDEISKRISSDKFLLNPTVFCEFTIELLKDAVENDVELDVEEFESGLRYWADPTNSPKPVWSRPRKDDPWGMIDDEALWKIPCGTIQEKFDFLERIGMDINTLMAKDSTDSLTVPTPMPVAEVEKTRLDRDF